MEPSYPKAGYCRCRWAVALRRNCTGVTHELTTQTSTIRRGSITLRKITSDYICGQVAVRTGRTRRACRFHRSHGSDPPELLPCFSMLVAAGLRNAVRGGTVHASSGTHQVLSAARQPFCVPSTAPGPATEAAAATGGVPASSKVVLFAGWEARLLSTAQPRHRQALVSGLTRLANWRQAAPLPKTATKQHACKEPGINDTVH